MPGRAYVIDDDDAVRDSLAALLEAAGHDVRSYDSALSFLDQADALPAGCVVTDVRMPGVSGLELLGRLGGRLERYPTIVLTGEADVPMAVEALKGGAVDFIEKPYDVQAILAAVDLAIERLTAAQDRAALADRRARQVASLSAREREVLDGLLAGSANKEIARDLGISHRTVEAYRAKLMVKMNVETLPELVQAALQARG